MGVGILGTKSDLAVLLLLVLQGLPAQGHRLLSRPRNRKRLRYSETGLADSWVIGHAWSEHFGFGLGVCDPGDRLES